jgi:DNA-binding NarL/FixJ family response regulator
MGMPVMSGLLAMKQLRAQGIRSKVIFLTMHADPSLAWEAMQAGAEGYVLKDSAGEELVMAITQVLRGNIYLSSRIAHQVMVCRNTSDESTQRITPRQRDVLQLIVAGRTMKEVGAILDLSPRTIETHKYSMMQVLGCRTTAELMQYALRHKLVDSSLTC